MLPGIDAPSAPSTGPPATGSLCGVDWKDSAGTGWRGSWRLRSARQVQLLSPGSTCQLPSEPCGCGAVPTGAIARRAAPMFAQPHD